MNAQTAASRVLPEQPAHDAIALSATPTEWRVLLVDDEPTQRLIVARLLKRAGYAVDVAQNGLEAMSKIVANPYHLLITDWEMPEMDGVTLCREVRAAQLHGYVYTMLLTARDAVEHLVAGLHAGADDYLVKPILEPELLARLNTGKRIVTLERSLRAVVEENRRLSTVDPLTGAYNRRYLTQQLPAELARSTRYPHPLALIMCDVDHFKRVNDTHGHQVGDEVLRQVVATIRGSVRKVDWLARYGGEEFVLVLPETTFSNGIKVAENLRQNLAGRTIDCGEQKLTITASFGVTGWDGNVPAGATVEDLFARCDACVYESKNAGRNRVSAKSMDEQ